MDAPGTAVPRTPCIASRQRLPLHTRLFSPPPTPCPCLTPGSHQAVLKPGLTGSTAAFLEREVNEGWGWLCPRARSPVTYDGLLLSLLHLAPVPAPALALLAVLTPGKRGRGGQPGGAEGGPAGRAATVKEKPRNTSSAAVDSRGEIEVRKHWEGHWKVLSDRHPGWGRSSAGTRPLPGMAPAPAHAPLLPVPWKPLAASPPRAAFSGCG